MGYGSRVSVLRVLSPVLEISIFAFAVLIRIVFKVFLFDLGQPALSLLACRSVSQTVKVVEFFFFLHWPTSQIFDMLCFQQGSLNTMNGTDILYVYGLNYSKIKLAGSLELRKHW